MEFNESIETGNLRRIIPLEKINEEGAELKEFKLREEFSHGAVICLELNVMDRDTVTPSTSAEMGVRSPRTEIDHYWQLRAANVENNLSSDEEEFDSTQILTQHLEDMKVSDAVCPGERNVNAGGDSDIEDPERWGSITVCEAGAERAGHLNSWLTTVGPMKKMDPTNLRRVVEYGQMQEVEEVSVPEGSAPEALHTTLEEINEKRRSLGKMVRNASRRLTTTASLPPNLRFSSPQNLKTSAAIMLKKGRTFFRNTGKFLHPERPEKNYFTCQAVVKPVQDDTLSDQLSVRGDSEAVLEGSSFDETTRQLSEKNSKTSSLPKKEVLRRLFNVQILKKLSQKSKGEEANHKTSPKISDIEKDSAK